MTAVWPKLETHVVNGAFPLQRCVGSTDHSGVYLTQSTKHAPSAVALKLVPFDPASAALQLSRWRAAAELSHPHLVRIFEVGECRLGGQPFLYARMEFAEQTLVQVLEKRPLTEDEVRDMLGPTLGLLEYLHRNGLVHGGLKPSNFLVVGNRLKLASDTVRALDESDEASTPAADVHALGLTLCEALTRIRPSRPDGAGGVALPAELPASFHEIVSRCLAADPRHRPTVSQLQAWLDGAPLAVPVIAEPASRLVIRVELPSEQRWQAAPVAERERERERRSALPWVLGAVALVVLVVGGWFAYRTASTGSPATEPVVAAPATQTPTPTPAPAPQPPAIQAPPAAAEPSPASRAASAYTPVDEVMPNVSRGALDTITGTVRVAVRVTVDRDGGVVAATAEVPGPSRYFERRSLEAARKWTFAPVDADEQRHLLLRFNFRQSGVTSSAEPLP